MFSVYATTTASTVLGITTESTVIDYSDPGMALFMLIGFVTFLCGLRHGYNFLGFEKS